jgi:hypothetical protein
MPRSIHSRWSATRISSLDFRIEAPRFVGTVRVVKDPLGVEDVAQIARADQVAEPRRSFEPAIGVVDFHQPVGLLRGVQQAADFVAADAQRLLDEDGQPALERR